MSLGSKTEREMELNRCPEAKKRKESRLFETGVGRSEDWKRRIKGVCAEGRLYSASDSKRQKPRTLYSTGSKELDREAISA